MQLPTIACHYFGIVKTTGTHCLTAEAMNKMPESLRTVFTQNRSEELGNDVWSNFVVPPFYDSLDLQQARKPRIIIGGRGCGKTMLLRYLCYESTFSKHKHTTPPESIQHIGLYWRADTQFAVLLTGRGLSQDTWQQAFNHLLALVIAVEIFDSLEAIVAKEVVDITSDALHRTQLHGLSAYGHEFSRPISEVRNTLTQKMREFELWSSNAGKLPEPIFLPGRLFVLSAIAELQKSFPQLQEAIFFVYLDEYENLLDYQQRIINTDLKHSQIPLIYNIAMKRNGFLTKKTIGEESIVDVADFRTYDIEDYLDQKFELFAAEVLLLTLHQAGWQVPIVANHLRDPKYLAARSDPEYRNTVLTFVRRLFPTPSHEDLADDVFTDDSLRAKLVRMIERALKERGSSLSATAFVRQECAQASIVTSALLYRKIKPQEVIDELDALQAKRPNRFTGSTDWIQNNFVGCLLALYESSLHVCPLYAGFDSFSSLAKGNLRHFLELCHRSLNEQAIDADLNRIVIDPQKQAQAARYTSNAFLGEVRSFGRFGNRLHSFVLRLGSVFAIAHQRATQSEPEQSHFSINRGAKALEEDDELFLAEAVKWSVLFREKETKAKNTSAVSSFEYILNPIYAPYFNITYRKRRRLELSVDDFLILEKGNYDDVNSMLKRFSNKWDVNIDEANPNLFTHLLD